MMICPETFYEMRLKGKTSEQIMTVIRSLKREITKLKNIIEHPNYELRSLVVEPTEQVQLSMNREYLERAKKALIEAGGCYTPSIVEQKAIDFDANIPYINKIILSIGGFLYGYETTTYIIKDDKIEMKTTNTFGFEEENGFFPFVAPQKDYLFEQLKNLHIGEWRKKYDINRFNIAVMDGTQWNLEIYYSNGRRSTKIHGNNAYPYNFNELLKLFNMHDADL